jgi:pimeloyl-ACP methyl ester carboxylesterase
VAPSSASATVSARWLIPAIASLVIVALVCAWLTLCLLFWQGSWQLLYRPTSAVTRTPASIGLSFDVIQFADTKAGIPQLRGWWIPAATQARYTALYLHGATGNLSDTVDDLARIHAPGLDVFAFDYRGYGQSQFEHPSETRMREDVKAAIVYLTDTRHIGASSIVLIGKDLGANLALQTAAAHPDFAGVVLESPLDNPVSAVFNDPRARIVPAHALVRDRWDTNSPAASLLIPSLWLYWTPTRQEEYQPLAYQASKSRKSLVWLTDAPGSENDFHLALSRWLDDLRPDRESP